MHIRNARMLRVEREREREETVLARALGGERGGRQTEREREREMS